MSRFLPIAGWLPRYDRGFLRVDAIAGATVWGLLVPESIAYAGLAGLAPEAGLYALLAFSVGDMASSGSAEYVADAAALVPLCGGLFLVAGLLRLGFIAPFLSRPSLRASSETEQMSENREGVHHAGDRRPPRARGRLRADRLILAKAAIDSIADARCRRV